jgi:hypothetical protein
MFSRLVRGLAPLLLFLPAAALAQSEPPVTPADLRRHIDVLASDAFEGRAPATEGERRATAYIVEQWRARGLEPAGENGSWFQAVPLVERAAGRHEARWTARGRALDFDPQDILLLGRDAQEAIADAPVIFAGHGARLPERGVDQLAGIDLRGAIVLILLEGPDVPGFPSLVERRRAVTEAGAAAVIAVVGSDIPWPQVRGLMSGQVATRLATEPVPQVTGAMPIAALQRLLDGAGGNLERLLNEQPGSSFRAVALPLRATLDVVTTVNRYTTNNVIGRIRGSGSTGESLLFLGHWDHFGVCRAESEPDRVCNGAVDNASGIAALIEIAGRLARQPRRERDILFLATTAEEMGLLGAEHFAAQPPVPLDTIVAAINLDTIAIHPAGEPVAVIGRGVPALDAVIDAAVADAGRRLDADGEADVMVRRQDGWALTRLGVPAIMVGGSFSNMENLNAFLAGTYHGPDDEAGAGLILDGAAEDATLLVALGRRLADPAGYARPASGQE